LPVRALVVAWGLGGNLPPLLGAASVLARRGHEVTLLASERTRGAVERLGFPVRGYRRTAEPDTRIPFERQAERIMATAAGVDVALDARDVLEDLRPDLAIVDCMLPAALAAARATGTPAVSLVHFFYGPARTTMLREGGGYTTDLRALTATHEALGLGPVRDGLAVWEAVELLLVTAPRWLDLDAGPPAHVVHAGPLDVRTQVGAPSRAASSPQRVLLTFSTTVMDDQPALVDRVCTAVAALDVHAVLTLGPALDRDALDLPDQIEVLEFGDHDRLMPTCAAVVGHGGLGTMLRALAHGLPQLLLPLGRDQAFNASRTEQLAAGIVLPPDAPAERISTELRTLLAEPRFAVAARQAAARIAADQPDRTAAEALERTAR
jgi:UDP:flavonoid glycosyltransferase YjiC (YdhE family)